MQGKNGVQNSSVQVQVLHACGLFCWHALFLPFSFLSARTCKHTLHSYMLHARVGAQSTINAPCALLACPSVAAVPDHDNEATYAYAAGDQAAYEEDAEGGVEAPRLRGATVLGKRSRSEEVAEASTEEMEPGMLEVPEAMQPSQEGAELAAEAAVAHAAAVAGAEAKHRAEGKRERERVRRATGKGPFGMALHPLKVSAPVTRLCKGGAYGPLQVSGAARAQDKLCNHSSVARGQRISSGAAWNVHACKDLANSCMKPGLLLCLPKSFICCHPALPLPFLILASQLSGAKHCLPVMISTYPQLASLEIDAPLHLCTCDTCTSLIVISVPL
eukprot:1157009-Pelagomonas_calceolata.AAC.8